MKTVPPVLGKEALEVLLGLLDGLAAAQTPALGQPVDVGIDGKGWFAKGLGEDYLGRLVAHPGQGFKGLKGIGNRPAIQVLKDGGEVVDGPGLPGSKPAGPHDLENGPLLEGRHLHRRTGKGKELRGDLVDPLIGALGTEKDRNQERVGIAVGKGHARVRKKPVQLGGNIGNPLGFQHPAIQSAISRSTQVPREGRKEFMSDLHYFLPDWIEVTEERVETDLCVYGGTAAGIIGALTAHRQGLRVILLQPGKFLGGMTTGGLGWTDFGKKHVIGGAARQFYRDLGRWYGLREEEWQFEPKAATAVFDQYLRDSGIPVRLCQFLDQAEQQDGRITSIRLLGGLEVRASWFMDATYEGDLLAKAGVSYHLGRESNAVHGETINGTQIREKHQFTHPVDPYRVPRDPRSGTLPGIRQQECPPEGSGDACIQAYNFRVCMTDDPDLRIPWEKPDGFDDREYELARRWFACPQDDYNALLHDDEPGAEIPAKFDVLRPRTANGFLKTDTNNHGPLSSDFIGRNYLWPEADYSLREKIFQEHVTYQKGLYWFMAHDPAIPGRLRAAHERFGLAADEFSETGGWPHQLYVREGRRMVSDYVLSEQDTQHRHFAGDPVGMGSYQMDSHNCRRFVRQGRVLNEGDVQLPPAGPYPVSYRSIVPARGECPNLAVPVCLSASHIAFGSVRMEPVFMVLAESAALALSLAHRESLSLQEVPYAKLLPLLRKAGQILTVDDADLP